MIKFMILAQPRSRSKWLSEYLTRENVKCGHDLVLGCSSVDEFVYKLSSVDGTVETGIGLGWRLWLRLFPYVRFGILLRPVADIAESFEKLGTDPDWAFLLSQDIVLRQFYKTISTSKMFWFDHLNDVETRRRACQLAGLSFDENWDKKLATKNIQLDMVERFKQINDHIDKTRSFINDMAKRTVMLRGSNSL